MQSAIRITKAQLWLILIIENLSQLLEDFRKMQAKPTCHFTFGYRQVKRRKKWPWIIGGLVALVLVGAALGGGSEEAEKAEEPRAVASSDVVLQSVVVEAFTFLGYYTWAHSTNL